MSAFAISLINSRSRPLVSMDRVLLFPLGFRDEGCHQTKANRSDGLVTARPGRFMTCV